MNKKFAVPKKHTRIVEIFLYKDRNSYWCTGGKDKDGLEYAFANWAKSKDYGIQKIAFLEFKKVLKYTPIFYIEEGEHFVTSMGHKVTTRRAGFYYVGGFKKPKDWK